MVAKFLDDNKSKPHLKSGFTLFHYCFLAVHRHCCKNSLLLWSRNFATMVTWCHTSPHSMHTKYACSDWLKGVFASEYNVNMVVTSFSFPCPLKFGKSLQTSYRYVNFFFSGTCILSDKNPYFGKQLLQNKNLLRVQDFMHRTLRLVRISLLISAIEGFSSGKLIYKSNRKLFSCICRAWFTVDWLIDCFTGHRRQWKCAI